MNLCFRKKKYLGVIFWVSEFFPSGLLLFPSPSLTGLGGNFKEMTEMFPSHLPSSVRLKITKIYRKNVIFY